MGKRVELEDILRALDKQVWKMDWTTVNTGGECIISYKEYEDALIKTGILTSPSAIKYKVKALMIHNIFRHSPYSTKYIVDLGKVKGLVPEFRRQAFRPRAVTYIHTHTEKTEEAGQ